MANKQVQEPLCKELKITPGEALQFAIAFEDGLKRQKSIGQPGSSKKIKEEPICAVSYNTNNRECWRCGMGIFTNAHLNSCNGQLMWQKVNFERCCNAKKGQKQQKWHEKKKRQKTNLRQTCSISRSK